MGVEAGAGGREDIQKGMDGGGRVTQVQNEIYKFLGHKTQKNTFFFNDIEQLCLYSYPISHTEIKGSDVRH